MPKVGRVANLAPAPPRRSWAGCRRVADDLRRQARALLALADRIEALGWSDAELPSLEELLAAGAGGPGTRGVGEALPF